MGFIVGKASPCIFYHLERDIRGVVHGDDFTVLGHSIHLDEFREKIKERYEVKMRGRLGPEDKGDKALRILNRVVLWTDEGIVIEADQRHADIIVQSMNIKH